VPDDAVVESNGSTLVFVKTGPERFEVREVSLGARSGKSWEVHAGLRPAERVVVAGTYALKSLAGR
jgi:multidrug efflux pump subunit AcrA (membrane-fusion protein)